MQECYEISLVGPDFYEQAALILSTLLLPGEKENSARERLYLSLCSWFIRDRASRDRDWALQPQMLVPNQACRAEADINKDLKTFERGIEDRITAGHMAIAFLKEAETGIVELPGDAKRLSTNEIARTVTADRGIEDPGNLETRVWRPSRPVIHLCAAWAAIARERVARGGIAPVPLEKCPTPSFFTACYIWPNFTNL